MTYAGHRRIIDVDSHVIELEDFLTNAASAEDKAKIPSMTAQTTLPAQQENIDRGRELFHRRQSDPETMAKFEAALMDNTKSGWSRLGAFDPDERSRALDLFGFEMQFVLPTFAFHQIAHTDDDAVLEVGARTLNTAMAEFCRRDDRMKAMGYIPLSLGPERSTALMREGFDAGCYSFIVDTNEADDNARSFTHPDFDPVWAMFSEADVPFANHVAAGGHYQPVSKSFWNNGRQSLDLGGDAPPGELGIMTIGNTVQLFLGAMIFDGVFDRHPRLRGISMEHGAIWLPSWLRTMDFTAALMKRKRSFSELPSETAKARIKVSPFAGEPVGWIVDQVGPEMLVFASDYPHPEGTGDPISKFEDSLSACDQSVLDAFYYDNMAKFLQPHG